MDLFLFVLPLGIVMNLQFHSRGIQFLKTITLLQALQQQAHFSFQSVGKHDGYKLRNADRPVVSKVSASITRIVKRKQLRVAGLSQISCKMSKRYVLSQWKKY